MPTSDNPFMARVGAAVIGRTGRLSERRTAKRLKAVQTIASGSLGQKGDMQLRDFLIEAKSTTDRSLRVAYEWLFKISKEAGMAGKTPALAVTFVDDAGRPIDCGNWVMVPEYLFKELAQ